MGKKQLGMDGRVVSTQGRRVVVRDAGGEDRVCFLSGQRAVIGDRVRFVPSSAGEGKLIDVAPRERALVRVDFKGREQEIAAWLGGLLVVASADQPAYRAGLVDRYLIGASASGLRVILLITKVDLGISDEVQADLDARRELGYPVVTVCNTTGDGMEELRRVLVERGADGPWALVGHSGVGKTSVIRALLPDVDVGPVGEISDFWEAGRHTTTYSRIFDLGDGVEIADSPGIRTFLPSGLGPETVRNHFPGMEEVVCRYRDCLHRPGEDGCAAEGKVEPGLLERYRRVLTEVEGVTERQKAW